MSESRGALGSFRYANELQSCCGSQTRAPDRGSVSRSTPELQDASILFPRVLSGEAAAGRRPALRPARERRRAGARREGEVVHTTLRQSALRAWRGLPAEVHRGILARL